MGLDSLWLQNLVVSQDLQVSRVVLKMALWTHTHTHTHGEGGNQRGGRERNLNCGYSPEQKW